LGRSIDMFISSQVMGPDLAMDIPRDNRDGSA
jgi:hypothetical protein